MPNRIKYNKTGSETNSVFKGNWAVDLRSHGVLTPDQVNHNYKIQKTRFGL